MRVIGTSGHVDHGKSTLVEKLSGINPDRLAEEQSRQMTIDLGFAWMSLANGETVGIVDVPGHRDFIENMLAGVGGIDAALLVIAADEGIMPQTREHLAILRLLDVKDIIVVISKVDLIDDPDWIELVRLDIEEIFAGQQMPAPPVVEVSAHSGQGLDQLIRTLQGVLQGAPQRVDYGQPRLPIDRVFVVGGFGTVVTGALAGGSLSVGDSVELQPTGIAGRIRGLQSYKQAVETVGPGSRVAVNIAGISSDQVQRGDMLASPGQVRPSAMVDAQFFQLADLDRPLEHNAEVKFFCGAAESMAKVRLLDAEQLYPGDEGWLQIRLRDALPLARGDRYILRFPSPAQTIGGGLIVDAQPRRRLKRFQKAIIQDLELRLRGTPAERLARSAEGKMPVTPRELQSSLGYSDEEIQEALREALELGLVKRIDETHFWSADSWQKLADRALAQLGAFHSAHPLRLGMPRAQLRSRLDVKLSLLDQFVERDERIAREGNLLRLHNHQVVFDDDQNVKIDQLMRLLQESPYTPPSIDEINDIVGEDVARALLDLRRLVNVNDRIAFASADYEFMVSQIRQKIRDHGEIDAKTLRDQFGTSRKYAIALLEHLDSLGITQRVGDVRKRGRNM
ncbi:MAG: selenocysteine-specific translation elongation factor [Chloroflexota bacterium]|nr:selenocysteine-specific translation elongation factor [Chloroflexota bacterium]